MVAVMQTEQEIQASAEKWLEEQFEKFDFQGFQQDDKSEIYAVFMNTLRPSAYEIFEETARHHDLIRRQSDKLRAIVELVRGPPPKDTWWSTHDADLLVGDLADKVKSAEKTLTTLLGFVENTTLKAVINEELAELRPRTCPNCGSVEITSSMQTQTFPCHPVDADPVDLQAEVRAFTCYICEQGWTDHTAEAARALAVSAHLESLGLPRVEGT